MTALRSLRALTTVALASLLSACSNASPDAATTTARVQACGEFSPLAQAVIDGANSGPATVSRVDWRYNTMVAGPIIGGQAFGDAVADLVSSATTEVIVESFILQDTWVAGRLRDAIAQLDPSIPVYVLFTTDTASTINLHTEGGMADTVLAQLDPDSSHNVIVAAWDGRIQIDHDKSIIVDRATVLVSNINMETAADPTDSGGNDWYQMGMILQGEIAGVAASEATSAWAHAGAIRSSIPGNDTNTIPTLTAPGGTGCTPMIALTREAGEGEDASADQAFASLFTAAQQVVHVQTPNLNDDGALAALVQATNDVDVYVVLSKGFTGWTEDIPGQGGSNVDVVEDRLPSMLADSGNPCNLHVRWYATPDNPGVAVDGTYIDGASHAKFASADSQVMVLGSQNMDTQSWKTSREFSIAIDDAATTQQFDDAYQQVWDRSVCAFECGGCSGQ
jgi:phosphatidylserine/phosphatidylglycerophosphate/cardiolipin synthase-like enzyme